MKLNNQALSEYKRVMNSLDISDGAKHQIITTCARYGTLKKIKSGKFRLTAVIKEKTNIL